MGFLNNLFQLRSRNKDFSLFCLPQGKGSIQTHPRGSKKSKDKLSNHKEETQSGLQGTPNEERQPQGREDQKDIGTFEPLMFFHELCNIEHNLLTLFNKLNNTEYTSGIVNLSKYSLQDTESLSYAKD